MQSLLPKPGRYLRVVCSGPTMIEVVIKCDGVRRKYLVWKTGAEGWYEFQRAGSDPSVPGYRASAWACTCPAGQRRKPCKHCAAVRKLWDLGELDRDTVG